MRALLLVLCAGLPAAGAAQNLLQPLGTDAWQWGGLPQQSLPRTLFGMVEVDGRAGLQIEAKASYGNLVHAFAPSAAATRLAWSWRLERPNAGADLRTREGDDSSLKVCALFDLPLERVPFVTRTLLRVARARSAQPLPAATLCYVWDTALPAETLLPNAYTDRVRYLVAQGAAAPPARWQPQRRDLAADWARAFPGEGPLPPLLAVAVGADADNTQGTSLGQVADPQLLP